MTSLEFNVGVSIYSPYGAKSVTSPGKTCIWLKSGAWLEGNNYGDIQAGDMVLLTSSRQTPADVNFRYMGVKIVKAVRDASGLRAWTNDFVLPKRFDGAYEMLEGAVSSKIQLDQKVKTIAYELADGKWTAAALLFPPNRTSFYWPASDNVQFVDCTGLGYDISDITGRPTNGQTIPGMYVSVNRYARTLVDMATGATEVTNITSGPTIAADPYKPQPLIDEGISAEQLAAAKLGIANEQKALANGTALAETVRIAEQTKAYAEVLANYKENPQVLTDYNKLADAKNAAGTGANPPIITASNPNPAAAISNPNPGAITPPQKILVVDPAPEIITDEPEIIPGDTAINQGTISPLDASLRGTKQSVEGEGDNSGLFWVIALIALFFVILKLLKIA